MEQPHIRPAPLANALDRLDDGDSAFAGGASPLVATLRAARPQVEEILARHQIPGDAAQRLLGEVLQLLAWKWESVRNRQGWLLAILERRCSNYAGGAPHIAAPEKNASEKAASEKSTGATSRD